MTLYRDIISKALILSWKHKYLWFLAFFAALAGNGGAYELVFSGSESISGQSYALGLLRSYYENGSLQQIMENVRGFFGTYPIPSIFLALLLLLVALLVIWIIIVAQAALVWAIARIRDNTEVGFPETFANGVKYFSPIFFLNLVSKVIVLGLIFLVALPIGVAYINTGTALYNSLYILVVFLALVPISIILSFIVNYASVYIIVRKQPWRTAFTNGWHLFVKNWLVSLEVAFLLFAINLVVSLLLIFLLLLLGLISTVPGTILFFAIVAVLGTLIATFQYSAWVYLFFELEAGRARPKLLRWADRLIGKTKTITPAPSTK